MLRHKLLILSILLSASSVLASVELFSFHAFAIVDHSRLEWSTGREEEFALFIIERSSDGQDFFVIGQIGATGSYSEYEFVDSSPLDTDSDRTFYYRLKMVDRDGAYRYSEILQVSLSFSAVQHTWGSIKAMFR